MTLTVSQGELLYRHDYTVTMILTTPAKKKNFDQIQSSIEFLIDN